MQIATKLPSLNDRELLATMRSYAMQWRQHLAKECLCECCSLKCEEEQANYLDMAKSYRDMVRRSDNEPKPGQPDYTPPF